MPMGLTAPLWLITSVSLAIVGSVLAFGLGHDFERPKALCLSVAAAMLIPRACLIWPTWPRHVRAAALIWLLVLAAAVLCALDPARALIGSFERSQGGFILVCCTIFALARVPASIIVAPVAVVMCVIGVWALAQFFGVESAIFSALGFLQPSSKTGWQDAFGGRAFASFGNPMALGNWLAMAWVFLFSVRFQAGYFQIDHSNRSALSMRMLECALFFGSVSVLLSGTRAAWLALSIVALLQLRQKKLVRIIGLAAFAGLVIALLSIRTDSVRARFELAGAALSRANITLVDGLGNCDPYPSVRLWLGYGPDLQVALLEEHLPQRAVGTMPDRAHQMLLDGYLSIGVLGIASWLGLMWALWRSHIATHSGTAFALLAALITWQFGFALNAEKALFALLLGSMCASRFQEVGLSSAAAMPIQHRVWPNIFAILFAIFSMLSYMPQSVLSLDKVAPWRRPERAIVHFERARLAIMENQGELAERELGQAVALDPWRSDLARAKANLTRELGHNSP